MSAPATFVTNLRESFPEFASETKYTAGMINFWYDLADTMLNVIRWGNLRTAGLTLYVAHQITIAAQNAASGILGAAPGMGLGVTSSESAGPISHSMDTQISSELDAGNFNLTTYGKEYIRLARLVGIGGFQVETDPDDLYAQY